MLMVCLLKICDGHYSVSPQSAQATDATGATPLHWATRNPELTLDVIDVLVKSFPDAPRIADNKVSLITIMRYIHFCTPIKYSFDY